MKVEDGIQYAYDVVDDKIVACQNIKHACKRFIRMYEDEQANYYFDTGIAEHFLEFCSLFKHHKGRWAGKQFDLPPWEVFAFIHIVGFRYRSGTKDEDGADISGLRVIKTAVMEVARKNGKSTIIGLLIIYEMLFGESGGELFSLATKKDQANIVFESVREILRSSPEGVRDRFDIHKSVINCKPSGAKYKSLSRDVGKSGDGTNPSFNAFDEAGCIQRDDIEVQLSGQGARFEFLNFYITTAYFDKTTKYYSEVRKHGLMVNEGLIDDPSSMCLVYTMDTDDEWKDERMWIKANPNLGVSLRTAELREVVDKSRHHPTAIPEMLTKRFNIWVSSQATWIGTQHFDKDDVIVDTDEPLQERYDACIGFDLARTRDLNSVTTLFRYEDGTYSYRNRYWIPSFTYENLPTHIKPIYDQAIIDGVLTITPGSVINYEFIYAYIKEEYEKHQVSEIRYDPYNATTLINRMEEDGLNVVKQRQNAISLNPGVKELERVIIGNKLYHRRIQFDSWQMNNCQVYPLPGTDNVKITKGDDANMKIDGMVSLIIAMTGILEMEMTPDYAPSVEFFSF